MERDAPIEEAPTTEDDADSTGITVADSPRRHDRRQARKATLASRLGHFHLLEQLGKGGMGAVYSAYDVRLDRKVAIKVLHERSASASGQRLNQRLLREAQAMAKLSHPNVVSVYEVGLDADTVFIAMEYVAGETLDEWLRTRRTWRDIVDVFVQAGRGLAAAHAAGIVHRDFKPSNVLVDERGHVRVTDFGIAQVRGDTEPPVPVGAGDFTTGELTPPRPSTPLTERDSIVGTPAYMSPEQFRSASVDARSDQFSFCVTLFEALFGRRPFKGSGKELARRVLRGEIERPEGSAVPARLTALVLRGLATDPAQRFPSMHELIDALARDPGRRRRRLALGTAAALAVTSLAAFAGWRMNQRGTATCTGGEAHLAGAWDPTVRATMARSFAATALPYAEASAAKAAKLLDGYRDRWTAMHEDSCRATHERREQSERVLDLRMACLDQRARELRALTSLLAAADAQTVEKSLEAIGALASIEGCADLTALMQSGTVAADPQTRRLRERLEQLTALRRLGHAKRALAPAKELAAEVRRIADPRLQAEALALAGTLETHAGDLTAAQASLAEALRRARQSGDPDLFVGIAISMANMRAEAGIAQSREAQGIIRVADAVLPDARDPTLSIELRLAEAKSLLALGRARDALPMLVETEKHARRLLGEAGSLVLHVQRLLAPALAFSGKQAEALATYDSLVTATAHNFGALHPTTIGARLDRCQALTVGAARDRAPACYAEALPDADRVLGPSNRKTIGARNYLGLTLRGLGKCEQARSVFRAALEHVPPEAWNEHWFVALDLSRLLGQCELALGNYRAALEACERTKTASDPQHVEMLTDTCIGQATLELGDPARAVTILAPLEAQAASAAPTDAAEWRFAYARALWASRRDTARARGLAEQARAQTGDEVQKQVIARWLAALPAK